MLLRHLVRNRFCFDGQSQYFCSRASRCRRRLQRPQPETKSLSSPTTTTRRLCKSPSHSQTMFWPNYARSFFWAARPGPAATGTFGLTAHSAIVIFRRAALSLRRSASTPTSCLAHRCWPASLPRSVAPRNGGSCLPFTEHFVKISTPSAPTGWTLCGAEDKVWV